MTKEEKKEYQRQYYLKNKELIVKRSAEYASNNREKSNAAKKAWRDNNLDKARLSESNYRMNNKEKRSESNRNYDLKYPEKSRAKTVKRRAKLGKAAIDYENNKAQIIEIYKNCPKGMQVDHIVPLNGENVSGLHVPWNLQYLTPFENMSKGNRYDPSI